MKIKKKAGAQLLVAVCLGSGVAGFVLRLMMLGGSGWAYPVLWVLSLLTMAVLALVSAKMGRVAKAERNFPASPLGAAGTALGAAMLLCSCVILLLQMPDTFDAVVYALGAGAAVGLLVQAHLRRRGQTSAGAGMVMALALAARLVANFRHWSSDPLIEDYCFQLLAGVFAMLSAYHLAGFPLNRGYRRMSLFCTHTATVFCLISLADGDISSRLFYGGIALWLFFGGCARRFGHRHRNAPQSEDGERAQ